MNKKSKNIAAVTIKKIGIISEKKNNSLQINIVKWNSNAPKIDIRNWYKSREEENVLCSGKGITLTNEEATKVIAMLQEYLKEQAG